MEFWSYANKYLGLKEERGLTVIMCDSQKQINQRKQF